MSTPYTTNRPGRISRPGRGGIELRTGAYALSLLAVPINVQAVVALEDGAKTLIELRRAAGSPPPTTFRGHLKSMSDLGILRRRSPDGSGRVLYELCESGRELLSVVETLRAWLAEAPDGPITLGTSAARSAVKAAAEGWSTGIMRALAAKALTLTALDRLISDMTYPSLERRLEAMRLAGQIEPAPSSGRGTPYVVTEWLRKAIAPLIAGVHWERTHLPEQTSAVTRVDVEAAFMIAIPMLRLRTDVTGMSRLAVELNGSGGKRLAGVMVEVEHGKIGTCTSRLDGSPTASGIGSATAWIRAVTDAAPSRLELEGDRALTEVLVEGLHSVLFGALQHR
jgi:DNA-binding HxlR family transcriptional regulator